MILPHTQGRVLLYLHLCQYHDVEVRHATSASAKHDLIGMVSCSTSALIAMSLLLALHMLAQSSVTVPVCAWMSATSVWSNFCMTSQCTGDAISLSFAHYAKFSFKHAT